MTLGTGIKLAFGVRRAAFGGFTECCSPRAKRGTPNAERRAFTLIEMIVLIIIIAVVSSVAVPAYSRFNATAKFQSVVRETMAMLDSARLTAIQSGADVTVQFDAQSATFMVVTQTQPQA